MKHIDLFSGIGGFALATEMVWGQGGVEHIFCDNEPFSQKILKKHWPESSIVSDIRQFTLNPNGDEHRTKSKKIYGKNKIQGVGGQTLDAGRFVGADILTGGFPCQPFSQAGRRRGTEDDRHLWPEMLRVIREFHPRWVVGENVGGLITWDGGVVFEQIQSDLESEGYSVQAFVIPAVALNAPHRRDRIWIVGHSNSDRRSGRNAKIDPTEAWKSALGNAKGRLGSSESVASNGIGKRSGKGKSQRSQSRLSETHEYSGEHATDSGQQHGGERYEQGMATNPGKRSSRTAHLERQNKDAPNAGNARLERGNQSEDDTRKNTSGQTSAPRSVGQFHHLSDLGGWDDNWVEVATRLCIVDDGLPGGLARPKGWRNAALKGAGNAIVPQVAAEIMRAIKQTDETYR